MGVEGERVFGRKDDGDREIVGMGEGKKKDIASLSPTHSSTSTPFLSLIFSVPHCLCSPFLSSPFPLFTFSFFSFFFLFTASFFYLFRLFSAFVICAFSLSVLRASS